MRSDASARSARRGFVRRLGWFALLWLGGVSALGLAAWLLRAVMHAAGMR